MLARNFVKTAIAVGVCGFVSTNALASDVTVYGKVKIDYGSFNSKNYNGDTTLDNWELTSRSSRFGIKGDYDIGETLKVIYLYEFGVNLTDGTDDKYDTFTRRNSYIGLQDNWGTVLAGRYDTALKKLQYTTAGKLDLFDDIPVGDYSYSFIGDDRIDNQIVYQSPVYGGGLQYSLQVQPGEQSGCKNGGCGIGNDDNDFDDNDAANSGSASIGYGNKEWYVGAAYNVNVHNADTARLSAKWNIGNVHLGFMYQHAENHDSDDFINDVGGIKHSRFYVDDINVKHYNNPTTKDYINEAYGITEQNAYLLSVGISMDKTMLQFQYTTSDNTPTGQILDSNGQVTRSEDGDDITVYAASIGATYSYSKRLNVYTAYSYGSAETNNDVNDPGDDDTKDQVLVVGTEFKF